MKRSISLRSQLFGLMALLVLLQSAALVSALMASRVFIMLDAEAYRLFNSTTSARTQTYNASVGRLVGNMSEAAQALSAGIQSQAEKSAVEEERIYLDDEAYNQFAKTGTETLISLLSENNISGAFFMLNGSNANKNNGSAHSAVYIRNQATGNTLINTSNYLMEIGPIAVSQQYKIPTSINWRLDIALEEGREQFYSQPIWAATEFQKVEMERYGFWATPQALLDDGQQVVCYTMPLLDRQARPCGVVGVEISLSLFTQHYLPNTDLPYSNSFYAITSMNDSALALDWYIPSGPLAQVYLRQKENLQIRSVSGTDLYEVELDELGQMYCSVQRLLMYSHNSPFADADWTLIGFVPQEVLHETSAGVRSVLIISIVGTTAVSFAAIFVITFITTRKISGLSQYIQGVSPNADIRFTRTGIKEIDELTAAVEMLNKSVRNAAKTTSKILELTLMPIGGFELSVDTNYVVLTEFVYQLLEIDPGIQVSREEWKGIYAELIRKPAQGYENVYQYDSGDGRNKWLRILEVSTDTGSVGVIVDETKDIEQHRKLAHELDFDALTHLYSRTAFKREAHQCIMNESDKIGAMIFVDLDNLKYTNDTFGHEMGDRLIIRAGEIFRNFEPYGGVVSRISGDEFAVYVHGYTTKDEIRRVIGKVFDEHKDYTLRTPDGERQRIRYSAGIAFYPDDSQNVTDLLKLSDYAMYEAKHNKKGAIFEFNKESYTENAYVLENREAINLLLDEGLIRFAYQPIVDARTGEIYAYEALMRPLLDTFKSPLEILRVAAAQSKLGQLEHLVMITAFQTVRELVPVLEGKKLFVNSIPSQFLSPEDQIMLEREYADIFKQVVIEITEAENDSPEHLDKKVAFVKRNGMQIAIDDFGSGYSNEIRILSMEPDILKVDIEMITQIDNNPDKQMLLKNLLAFCHSKGIRVVAEGVERHEELAELIHLGVDLVQGYYTGRPAFELSPIADEVIKEILSLQKNRG